jgi:hypothetical protein
MARKDRMTKEREQRTKERRSGGRLEGWCRVRKERLVDLGTWDLGLGPWVLGRESVEKRPGCDGCQTVISEKFAGHPCSTAFVRLHNSKSTQKSTHSIQHSRATTGPPRASTSNPPSRSSESRRWFLRSEGAGFKAARGKSVLSDLPGPTTTNDILLETPRTRSKYLPG